jgi:hypothetical protein
LPECGCDIRPVGSGAGVQKPDGRLRCLFAAPREWPCRKSAGQSGNELAPSHSV